MITYEEWVSREYAEWCNALSVATLDNFQAIPIVRRMLSLDMSWPREVDPFTSYPAEIQERLWMVANLGTDPGDEAGWTGHAARTLYYAENVKLHVDRHRLNSVVEVGGGVGFLSAFMRVLGFRGDYHIMDLPEVRLFQDAFLQRAGDLCEMDMSLSPTVVLGESLFVSLYALGEFSDPLKDYYSHDVARHCPHGFVLWNPHSGATSEPPFQFEYTSRDEHPLTHPSNKELTW